MPKNHKEYWKNLDPEVKVKRLAEMREYKNKRYIAECQAAGREYTPRPTGDERKSSPQRLAKMAEYRERKYKEKCEAQGKEYIPKEQRRGTHYYPAGVKRPRPKKAITVRVQREPVQRTAKLPTPLPSLPKPKHKMDPIKIGKQDRVLPTRKVDESKLVKLYIPERRMHVLYDPLKRTEQEVREKYKPKQITFR